jgi:predicted AAA+ superfamily ATPase
MNSLFNKSRAKIERIKTNFTRFLLTKINWGNQLIVIKGARGVGKTTLLLQYIKLNLPKDNTVLYISMDELFFIENNLVELAEEFTQNGGKHLFLDEVHKYPNWSREIKLIYDNYPDLQVVFTSSSILEIYKSESDLSRRAVSYTLPEMSMREFIELEAKIVLPSYRLDNILENHVAIASKILKKIKPILIFNKYNQYGAYPYFIQDIAEYQQKLINTINLIIEVDILAVENINFQQVTKIKKLLFAIATSVPFTPNISKIAEKVHISRQSLIKALTYLDKARLINIANKPNKGITVLSKPDKLYLNNTNIINAIANKNLNVGNLRETFFLNQLKVVSKVNLSTKSDFIVNDKYTFEIGGKNKTNKQIKGINNAYLVKDNIEYGNANIIPLWLFGFLY